MGQPQGFALQGKHDLLQGSSKGGLGSFAEENNFSHLIQHIRGLWAEVKLSWSQTLRDFLWAGALGAEGGGRGGGQVQEAPVICTPSSQLPAGPWGFSSFFWEPKGGWGRAGAGEELWHRHLSGVASRTASAWTGRIAEAR